MKKLSDKLKKQVENATVKIIKREGQGVLVHGGLILTAAHCVEFTCEGGIAVADFKRVIGKAKSPNARVSALRKCRDTLIKLITGRLK